MSVSGMMKVSPVSSRSALPSRCLTVRLLTALPGSVVTTTWTLSPGLAEVTAVSPTWKVRVPAALFMLVDSL